MTLTEHDLHANEIIYTCPTEMPCIAEKHGKFLFAAYGCCLIERQTDSGTFVYTAVNLLIDKVLVYPDNRIEIQWRVSSFGNLISAEAGDWSI